MHLFEALLALFEATGQGAWMDHAQRLLRIFRTHLYDPATGSLREFLGRRLEPAPQPIGLIREPGHQFEWAWLLHRYAALSGDDSAAPYAGALYAFGTRYGTHPAGAMKGATYDEVAPSGIPLKTSMLLWPQTEAVKAHLARYEETGEAGYRERAEAVTRLIFERFIAADRPIWRNQVDENGLTVQPDAPTRLLYHLIVFILEGERLGTWPSRSPGDLQRRDGGRGN
jgi:mannose-6-phosphate isomerase